MSERPLDASSFHRQAEAVLALVAEQLERATSGAGRVATVREPDVELARWPEAPGAEPTLPLAEFVQRLLDGSVAQHHPRYVGHQVSGPVPEALLAELVVSALNNGMAAWEAGPASTAIERRAVEWLAGMAGLPGGAGGMFTSGGSLGNLTALLAVRQLRAGFDAWEEGAHGGPPWAWLVGEQAHYSLSRAVRILGAGGGGVEPVASDGAFRMDASLLPAALERARARGRRVLGVVASAGSTATGAVDPLPAIAEFCAREGLWLHVDGAHGLSALLSAEHRARVEGARHADSLVWDAHKLLGVPALCTAVLYRRAADAYTAFAQDASYLFQGEGARWWDVGQRTLECTKRGMALPLWALLLAVGTERLGRRVASRIALTEWLADRLDADRDFEIAHRPDLDILCFRYAPPGVPPERRSTLQGKLRARLLAEGSAFLTEARLRGEVWLRAVVLNPWVTEDSLEQVLDLVRHHGAAVLTEP